MKLTRKENVEIEMSRDEFNMLMYYLSSCNEQTVLGDTDAYQAGEMFNTLHNLVKQ